MYSKVTLVNLYMALFSTLAVVLAFLSLYKLTNPSIWTITLFFVFANACITFAPFVKLSTLGMTLTSVLDIFIIIDISPWAAIFIKTIELMLLSVVGTLPVYLILFNLGQISLSVIACNFTISILHHIGMPDSVDYLLSTLVFFLLNSIFASVFFALRRKNSVMTNLKAMWKDTALSYLSLLTLGVIMAVLYRYIGVSSIVVTLVLYFFIRFMLKQKIEDSKLIKQYADELKIRYNSSILSLARAIDARDPYTFGHSLRVAEMSKRLAGAFAPQMDTEDVYFGGLLHDVGKIALSDDILLKPGRLDPEELAKMMQHPVMGVEILRGSGVSQLILQTVRSHHEWVRGGGYPDNTNGHDIPLVARIVSITDAFDAMVSNRPYRRGCSIEDAIGRLEDSRDSQFDGSILNAFVQLINSMSHEELKKVGYGEKPPNSEILPVAELPNPTTTLAERLQHIMARIAERPPEVVEEQPEQIHSVFDLDEAVINGLTTREILLKLGIDNFVGAGKESAATAVFGVGLRAGDDISDLPPAVGSSQENETTE